MKTVSWSAWMKKRFPDRPVTEAEAEAGREAFERLAATAKAAGWTPEHVASLDAATQAPPAAPEKR